MRRIATALFCTLLLLATGALAGPQPGGYPEMCTDVSDLSNASNQAYVTCAEKKAGTSTTYPGYARVQDGNGTTLADVFPWSTVTAGTSVRGLATLGVVGFVAGNTWTQAIAGAGAVTAGTQRVTLASDDPAVAALEIMDDWDESDRAAVNLISGQVGVTAGSGATDASTLRVVSATDDSAVIALQVIDDWDATDDAAAASDGPQVMAEANTSQRTAVDDGDAVPVVANENGEIVIAGYQWATNLLRTSEVDPISAHHEESTLCDLTNIATNTTDYCGYIDMDGYKGLSVQIETSGAAPTDVLTVTFECTNQDDGTAPDSCEYQDRTNDLFAVVSTVDADDWWENGFVPAKYCRVKYVTSNDSGNDADLTVFVKKLY